MSARPASPGLPELAERMKFRRLRDLDKAKAVIAKLRALKYFPRVPAADWRAAYGELSGGEEL